jgi:hypothetical protein
VCRISIVVRATTAAPAGRQQGRRWAVTISIDARHRRAK